jgi:hypothetical protein
MDRGFNGGWEDFVVCGLSRRHWKERIKVLRYSSMQFPEKDICTNYIYA